MTFSEKKVVAFVKEHFVPVWDAVAPATESVYDLGDGRKVKGVVNGEIALYFCRPDGKAFDILPALQSPADTLLAMQTALQLYKVTDGATDLLKLAQYHRVEASEIMSKNSVKVDATISGLADRDRKIGDASTDSTRDLRVAIGSKTRMTLPAETITVVEPGGTHYYKWRVHKLLGRKMPPPLVQANPREPTKIGPALKSPSEWKKQIFEDILEMPLTGHSKIYDTSSVAPFLIVED